MNPETVITNNTINQFGENSAILFNNAENLSHSSSNDKYKKLSNKNIGRNIVINLFNKKRVLGVKNSFWVLILINLAITITVFSWILSNSNFFPIIVYVIGFVGYIETTYNIWMTFLTEPGIIPRNHPDYAVTDNLLIQMKEKQKEEEKQNKKVCINRNSSEMHSNINIKEQEKNDDDIPSIYKGRHCGTCNIIRPPKSSHCRICDNCVQDFDHHCFFVSNCIGGRNHIYFYRLCIYGTLLAIYVSIMNIIHFIWGFILYPFPIFRVVLKASQTLAVIALICFGFTLACVCMGSRDLGCLFIPALVGILLSIYLFYSNLPKDRKFPFYYNPISILSLIGSIPLGLFVGGNLVGQTFHIGNGYTVKQYDSIMKEVVSRNNNKHGTKINREFYREKTCKEKFINIKRFLTAGQIPSLINIERDLNDNNMNSLTNNTIDI